MEGGKPMTISYNDYMDVTKPEPTRESWWVGKPQDAFYREARQRHPELAAKYGSAPVSVAPSLAELAFFSKRGR